VRAIIKSRSYDDKVCRNNDSWKYARKEIVTNIINL